MKTTRREFVVLSAAAAASAVGPSQAVGAQSVSAQTAAAPWYRRVRRWGQINITEDDGNMDVGFWRRYLKDPNTQGTIINSGGVVNYYDSKIPGSHKGLTLGNRDLLGELVKMCREDGIVYVARMTNAPTEETIKMHPEWMCQDVNGKRTCPSAHHKTSAPPAAIARRASRPRGPRRRSSNATAARPTTTKPGKCSRPGANSSATSGYENRPERTPQVARASR